MATETETLASPPRQESGFQKLIGSPLTWLGFFTIAFGFHIGRAMLADPPPEPPKIYYQVPRFTFTDQFNTSFGSEQLDGKIWIADFIFTHCPTRCEGLTQSMAKVQTHLRYMRDSVMLVSFSVDPENDTPDVLKAYAEKRNLNQARWRFLTGDLAQIQEAVVKGFKLPMEKAEPPSEPLPAGEELMTITHGTKLVLIDQQHRIRGYYDPDEEGMKQMLQHISLLAGFERVPGATRKFEEERDAERN